MKIPVKCEIRPKRRQTELLAEIGSVEDNAVIVKPSSDAPTIDAIFTDILYETGAPRNVVSFLSGTGCLRINEQAARAQLGQLWNKGTFLEMGGNDSVVADDGGNLDMEVERVAVSAFGYDRLVDEYAPRISVQSSC